jgi:hypothetical protein
MRARLASLGLLSIAVLPMFSFWVAILPTGNPPAHTGLERNFVSVLIGVLVFIFERYDPEEPIGLKSRIGWKRWTGREKEFVRCPVCFLVGAEGQCPETADFEGFV